MLLLSFDKKFVKVEVNLDSRERENQPLSLKCCIISGCTPLPSEIILIKRCNDCEDKPSSTRQHCRHVDSSDCEANYSKPRLKKTLFLDSSTDLYSQMSLKGNIHHQDDGKDTC